MASMIQKKIALRRKLYILKNLTKSKSVKRSSIIRDAFIYIYNLKLQLHAIRDEYLLLLHHIQEVKVEKVEKGYAIKVTCKREEELLVKILETIEEKGFNVVYANVTCNYLFCMETIVEARDHDDNHDDNDDDNHDDNDDDNHDDNDDDNVSERDLTEALVKVIQNELVLRIF